MRRLLAGLLVVPVLALSGCVKITSQSASQQQQIGDVRITTTFCLSNGAVGTSCPASQTNSGQPAGNDHARLLLGYRVPAAAVSPATISVSSTDPAGTLTLTPSATYTAELQRLAQAPAGQKWVGYISPDVASTQAVPDSTHTATADFGLGRGDDGSPYTGPFEYLVVAGGRGPTTAFTAASATVACGTGLTTYNAAEQTICSDSPMGAPSPGGVGGSVTTKDVGVLNGTTVTAEPGQALSVPFQIKSAGIALPIMNLSAGTTAPAATATPSVAQVQPVSGTQDVPVSLNVAANTPPGTYDVTLTGTTPAGQLRTGKWQVTVTTPSAPPAQQQQPQQPQQPVGDTKAPVVSLAFAGKVPKLKAALKKGLKFTVNCDEACSAVLTLKKGKTKLATGKAEKLAPGGQFTVTVKFSKKVQKKYARAKKLKLSALLAVKDGAGLSASATRTFTLKP